LGTAEHYQGVSQTISIEKPRGHHSTSKSGIFELEVLSLLQKKITSIALPPAAGGQVLTSILLVAPEQGHRQVTGKALVVT